MDAVRRSVSSTSLGDAEAWLALGAGALLVATGARRRSAVGACLAIASVPLLYRGLTGHWPVSIDGACAGDTRSELGGSRGVHVRESIRVERPVPEVFRAWRRLEDLPRFMSHLDSVTPTSGDRSRWVAVGPGGLRVEWDAEIINEIDNHLLAWRSLPGSDVATAGSVSFSPIREGRATHLAVHLQYSAPAGKTGARIASLFGREPSQTIREDLRHFKQQLEAGERPRTKASE